MILLTGGTGFLGKTLLRRMLELDAVARFCLLVRPAAGIAAETRVEEVLSELFPNQDRREYASRIEILEGDLTLDNFGLAPSEFAAAAQRTSQIYHCAALTALNQKLEDGRRINVGGTRHVVRFAEAAAAANQTARLFHVSTAYVAGDTEDTVHPHEIGKSFRNYYEQSKAEAELLVREASSRVQTTIFRPSVIVGDSSTGHTSSFNVIYIPARFLVQGLLSALPAAPHTPFDVVPVDHVVNSMLALSKLETASGSAFHLCAGVGRESTPREILDFIVSTFNKYRRSGIKLLHAPQFVAPEMWALAQSSFEMAVSGVKNIEKLLLKRIEVLRQTLPFIPYMLRNPRFDTTTTTTELHGILPPAPLFKQYAEKIFRYCILSNWGKIPVS